MKLRSRYLGTLLLLLGVFMAGFVAGQATPTAYAQRPVLDGQKLERIEQVWTLIHEQYFEQPVDDEQLIQGAISGMLSALQDDHTGYMPPDEFAMRNASLDGAYSGIGAMVEAREGRLLIVSPFDDSPAEQAGLRPGDEIIKVDDTPVSEFADPLSAITLVRGPAGEPVTLLIRRNGREFEVTIVRETIPLVSVSGEMREDGLGYIRISDFSQQTTAQLRETLVEILAEEPEGLILDLRGNPGGTLNAAIQVADQFVGEGELMIEQWGNREETVFNGRPGGLAADPALPLIVLIDGGSASASEIVAAAIQAHGRGRLLGEQSYGKGTVQSWQALGEGNGGVRITIARWLTPDRDWIDGEGITPDIAVEMPEATWQAEQDIQLEGAASLLLGNPLPEPAPAEPIGKLWKCIE